jgi:thiol-disulfide isomerase/thioredoxin
MSFPRRSLLFANYPDAIFADGLALAHLEKDEAAKERFEQFVKLKPGDELDEQRALRYINQPELARARMAPPFAVVTIDGQHVSLDQLKGKVVLLDFWATWCGPCREALPHMKDIARHFEGQPLVILSVSLDTDEAKWKEFVAKNRMTWLQTRDGGFTGPISRMFAVEAIPHTFTIDADCVLQDEQIGDASIERKLKKLVAHANGLNAKKAGL